MTDESVNPAMFRLRTFEIEWLAPLRAQLKPFLARDGGELRLTPAGVRESAVMIDYALALEAEQWLSLGQSIGYFGRTADSSVFQPLSWESVPGWISRWIGSSQPSYGEAPILEFSYALAKARDELTVERKDFLRLVCFSDDKEWGARLDEVFRVAEQLVRDTTGPTQTIPVSLDPLTWIIDGFPLPLDDDAVIDPAGWRCALLAAAERTTGGIQERLESVDTARIALATALYSADVFDSMAATNELPASNVEPSLDDFIGRETILATARDLLTGPSRLVTITGPAGVGKSRLAQELAVMLLGHFDDHVYTIDLSQEADPDFFALSVVRTFKLRATEISSRALKEVLDGRQALIVLDNVDRLQLPSAMIQELLDGASGLRIVVTSRSRFQIADETVLNLPRLSTNEAVTLFRKRLGNAQTQLSNTEDSDLRVLCERLDCLPLAIELAASHGHEYSSSELASMLERFSPKLGTDVSSRRRTDVQASGANDSLRSAISWSYSVLRDSDQELFRDLSVFEGGWSLQTAAGVLRSRFPDVKFASATALLLNYHLITEERRPVRRFNMHPIVREYALEIVRHEPSDFEDLRERHAGYYLAFAEERGFEGTGRDLVTRLQELEIEYENLSAALRYFRARIDTESALRLTVALGALWWSRDYSEGLERVRLTLQLPSLAGTEAPRARALALAGRFSVRLARLEDATALFSESLVLARHAGHSELQAQALGNLALVATDRGKWEDARDFVDRALTIQRAGDDTQGEADSLDSLGVIETAEGHYDLALDHLLQSLSLYRTSSDLQGEAWVRCDLARLALARGDTDTAKAHAEAALATARRLKDFEMTAWASNYLGVVASSMGRIAEAHDYHDESLTLAVLLGDDRLTVLAFEGFAVLAVRQESFTRGLVLDGVSDRLRDAAKLPRTIAESAIFVDSIGRALTSLSKEEADAARTIGRSMSLDEAVTVARNC